MHHWNTSRQLQNDLHQNDKERLYLSHLHDWPNKALLTYQSQSMIQRVLGTTRRTGKQYITRLIRNGRKFTSKVSSVLSRNSKTWWRLLLMVRKSSKVIWMIVTIGISWLRVAALRNRIEMPISASWSTWILGPGTVKLRIIWSLRPRQNFWRMIMA